jgi:hypothetical protein
MQSELLQRFLEAIGTGEMEGLISLLANDVALHSDGGGKAVAVPNVVYGADKVARGIIGALMRLLPKDMVRRTTSINGKIGLINYHNGKPHSVLPSTRLGTKFRQSTSSQTRKSCRTFLISTELRMKHDHAHTVTLTREIAGISRNRRGIRSLRASC